MIPVNSRRRDYKLIGATLPGWMSSYVTLYTLAKGTTKARIVKELVDAWMIRSKIDNSEEELLHEIIMRVNGQWEMVKGDNMTFTEFKDSLKIELTERGVMSNHINIIINGLLK